MKEMFKKNARWFGLAAVAVPVIALTVPPLLPSADVNYGSSGTSSVMEPVQNASVDPVPDNATGPITEPALSIQATVKAKPTTVIVAPPVQMQIALNKDAQAIINKTAEISLKQLDAALEEAKAKERQAKSTYVEKKDLDPLGLGDAGLTYLSQPSNANTAPDTLSRVVLNSLITTDGKTSAYLSVDDLMPVRVTKGSELGDIRVEKITEKGVTVSLNDKTRFLSGASYE
ncbi:hypothetical protein TUM4438_10600 [Shewanella sairae]|uniref:Type IV pilus biogenesis protein PilP n=1 Tax=Shewanella sairae TaxID=190310 RepID=A0ABQ4P5T5_9GAMM|nr:hypothetical protein [Shewanella sairae]MCL1130493.1 hypothetical protein [Shewanella sairae]GIU42912.1 hypothetical protein TUM4438_10600 [Shewanella sairae]